MKGCGTFLESLVVFAYASIFAITVYVMAMGDFDGWKLTLAIIAALETIGGFFQISRFRGDDA